MMYLGIFLLAISVFFWRLNSRDQYNWVAILHGVLTASVFFIMAQGIDEEKASEESQALLVFFILTGILAVNMALSHVWKSEAVYWAPLFVLLSSGALFLLPTGTIDYLGFGVNVVSFPIILFPLLGALIEPIAAVKEKVLANFFDIDFKNRRGISRSVFFFLFGVMVLIAHFMASYFGVALLTLGYASSLFYGKKMSNLWNSLLALLAITTLGYFGNLAEVSESSLLLGRVLAGIFFGGFVALIVNTLVRAKKNTLVATILNWTLIFLVTSILILAGTQNINFGGGDAFIGLLVGFALAAAYGINTRKNDTVLSLYLALGIFLIPLTINKEAEEMTKISVSDSTKTDDVKVENPFELPGKTIDLSGEYQIIPEKSQLTFELGPKGGRTKGAFKTFEGNFEFGEKTKIQVKLPVKQLSTFNSYRDESLMEASYFNEAKYPEMKFEASSMKQNGDFYEVDGNFTMLAKTKSIKLEMKYIGKASDSENIVFIGRSSLNRVDFGMKSDPKEGDVVDFQFKVELSK